MSDDMADLSSRSERLIAALTNGFLGAAEAAAERMELASDLARFRQRMGAFSAALEVIAAQKNAIAEQLAGAKGALKALLQAQLDAFSAQELAVLTKAGVPLAQAQLAVAAVDEPKSGRKPGRYTVAESEEGGSPTPVATNGRRKPATE